ncbi:Protein Dispatched-like 3, partial [Manis pentadactyla]
MHDASGYVERTETLALRKELGSWSDVTGSARCWNRVMGKCEIQFQDYSEAIVVFMVILEFQATGLRLELASDSDVRGDGQIELHVTWYGMTDIEADGVGSETLALRKELGSWSDVTGVQDVGTGLCGSELPYLRYGMTDIEADGVGSALWKDFGSGSDMTRECKMVDQGYGEAWVTSVVKLKGLWLGLGFPVREKLMHMMSRENSALTLIECEETLALRKELGSWSRCGRECKDVGTVLWLRCSSKDLQEHRVAFEFASDTDVRDGQTGLQVYFAARQTLKLMATLHQGECEIQFQDYSEAIVVSMVILGFRPQVRAWAMARLSFMFTVRHLTDIEADGVGS